MTRSPGELEEAKQRRQQTSDDLVKSNARKKLVVAGPGTGKTHNFKRVLEKSGGGLAPRSADFTQPRSYVEVDSIDDVVAAAVEAGATVTMEKDQISPTSWWAVIADPDGNAIGLYEGTTEA